MGTAIELITACDIRIAADNAKFSLREVDVGISTDLGGTTRLTKLIGPGMTKLLAMTCEDIDAQEAARIRLVERVVPLGELEQTTLAYAEKACGQAADRRADVQKVHQHRYRRRHLRGAAGRGDSGHLHRIDQGQGRGGRRHARKRHGRYTCE